MRLFIAGQKWLAQALLEQCRAEGHEVVGVAAPSPDDGFARAAVAVGIDVAVAQRRLDSSAVPDGVDLILCAHAHCFIPADTRARARLGALGYHPSLLPRHRGRDAIRWAIHMREPFTGGTIYWMDDGADTGPLALQAWCHILPEDDAGTLWRRELGPLGLHLFSTALALAAEDRLPRVDQDEALATWEPSFSAPRLARQ